MGFFSDIIGFKKTPTDWEIASMIASHIEYIALDSGFSDLFDPDVAICIGTKYQINMIRCSEPHLNKESTIAYVYLSRLPSIEALEVAKLLCDSGMDISEAIRLHKIFIDDLALEAMRELTNQIKSRQT